MRTLRHWRLDPFGRMVRAALTEKKLDFEDAEESPWAPSDAMLKADPRGIGPVLEFGGDVVAVGARAILEYLEEIAPEQVPLLHGTPAERAETRRLLDWFDRGFELEAGGPIRNEKMVKRLNGGGSPDMELLRPAREAVRWHLDYISWLTERRDWLAGRRMTMADLCAAAHISSLDYMAETPWKDFPHAKEWYARVKSRPCFRNILADRIRGAPPPAHYVDLDF